MHQKLNYQLEKGHKPIKYSSSRCFLIGSHCLCMFVCCVVEVRYDRLEAKLQPLSELSNMPGASTVQSLHAKKSETDRNTELPNMSERIRRDATLGRWEEMGGLR